MSFEVPFDIDAECDALASGVSWRAAQFERVVALRAQIARLEAEEARVLAGLLYEVEAEAGEGAVEAGDVADVTRRHDLAVRSLATELAASTNTSLNNAQQRLGEAWTLAHELRETFAALEAGQVSRAHVHELIAETAHLGPRRAEAETALLPWAKALAPSPFRRKAKQVLERLEGTPLHERHERALARRRVEITCARDGMARLEAYLDAADAVLIGAGLENAAREARQAGDPRTAAQLEADLLVGLLLDGQITIGKNDLSGAPAPGRSATVRAAVTVDVLIPAATLARRDEEAAVIPGFGAIDPARARELVALAPSLRRILTDPITGAALDFDRTTYRVPAELKRVLRLRDGHCRAPGCTAPLSRCELDHTTAAARGGPTALGNLAHLCANHHHLKHEAGWSLRQHSYGVLEWKAPSGRAYRTHPEASAPAPSRRTHTPTDPWNPPDTDHEPTPFDLPAT